MQAKTTGIILHQLKYTDSSSIVSIYTKEFGRVSYLVRGANKKKSACRAALLQPLSVVEIVVSHHPKKNIQTLLEMRLDKPFYEIPYSPVKNALALFLAELLVKTLKHTEQDVNLYFFLENSISELDKCKEGLGNFHLVFMMLLSRYLGFDPNLENEEQAIYFDLLNGVFVQKVPEHIHFLTAEITRFFKILLSLDYDSLDQLQMTRNIRAELLNGLVEYYKLHISDFQIVSSVEVLHKLWE